MYRCFCLQYFFYVNELRTIYKTRFMKKKTKFVYYTALHLLQKKVVRVIKKMNFALEEWVSLWDWVVLRTFINTIQKSLIWISLQKAIFFTLPNKWEVFPWNLHLIRSWIHVAKYWMIFMNFLFLLLCIVWSRSTSIYHHHQLIWHWIDQRWSSKTIPNMWKIESGWFVSFGKSRWLWSSQNCRWILPGKYNITR